MSENNNSVERIAETEKKASSFEYPLFVKLANDGSIKEAFEYYNKEVDGNKQRFRACLLVVFKQLSTTKMGKVQNLCAIICQLLRANKTLLSTSDLYYLALESFPKIQDPNIKVRNNSSLILAFMCLSRCGFFEGNEEFTRKCIRVVYKIGKSELPIRLFCFECIIEILVHNAVSLSVFESFCSMFYKYYTEGPENLDNLYFFYKIFCIYPEYNGHSPKIANLLSMESFQEFNLLFRESIYYLPKIHPLWNVLLSKNKTEFKTLIDQFYGNNLENDAVNVDLYCLCYCCLLPSFNNEEVLEFLQNKKLVSMFLKSKCEQCMVHILGPIVRNKCLLSKDILMCLLDYDDSHQFFKSTLYQVFQRIEISQFGIIEGYLNDSTFSVVSDFLFSQRDRTDIIDFSFIGKVFDIACNKCEKEEGKIILSKFLGSIIQQKTGKTLFDYIMSNNHSFGDVNSGFNELLKNLKHFLNSFDTIHQKLHIDFVVEFDESKDEPHQYFAALTALGSSKYPHLIKLSENFVKISLRYLPVDCVQIINRYPLLLVEGLNYSHLSASILCPLIKHTSDLPKEVVDGFNQRDPFNLMISKDEVEEIIDSVLSCTEDYPFHHKIVRFLFSLLDDQKIVAHCLNRISKMIEGENLNGLQSIIYNIEIYPILAQSIIDFIKSSSSFDKETAFTVAKSLVLSIIQVPDLDCQSIAEAIFSVCNRDYPLNSSGKKKAENSFAWGLKCVKKLKGSFERSIFTPLIQKAEMSGSRQAKRCATEMAATK